MLILSEETIPNDGSLRLSDFESINIEIKLFFSSHGLRTISISTLYKVCYCLRYRNLELRKNI
jgi:hypothetical protein